MRSVLVALVFAGASLAAGCSLYETSGSSPDAALDAAIDPARCPPHTATIFEPANGATVPTQLTTRVRWNEAGIPDRYMSMEDDFGNFFITKGASVVNGDGSITDTYDLPKGGSFTFEIGWFCDAANNGPTVALARARIHTAP